MQRQIRFELAGFGGRVTKKLIVNFERENTGKIVQAELIKAWYDKMDSRREPLVELREFENNESVRLIPLSHMGVYASVFIRQSIVRVIPGHVFVVKGRSFEPYCISWSSMCEPGYTVSDMFREVQNYFAFDMSNYACRPNIEYMDLQNRSTLTLADDGAKMLALDSCMNNPYVEVVYSSL